MPTATVEVLTAEVRALMVGSRQVTLSVYRQLDEEPPGLIEPFGRVRDSRDDRPGRVYIVGRQRETGALIRSSVCAPSRLIEAWCELPPPWIEAGVGHSPIDINLDGQPLRFDRSEMKAVYPKPDNGWRFVSREIEDAITAAMRDMQAVNASQLETFQSWGNLPLIVLAGLR